MRKTYIVEIILDCDGNRCLAVSGLIRSKIMDAIKRKVGDINKYPLNKEFKVIINE